MKIFTEIIGNIHENPTWAEQLKNANIEKAHLDQWTAQKSRFLITTDKGNDYAVSLKRHTPILDGDIVEYNSEDNSAVILSLALNEVLIIDLAGIMKSEKNDVARLCFEIGHAIGNQHWPAVFKNNKIYIPLTVDKKVMKSVLDTHHFEDISYEFQEGDKIIPYLHPHEVRRLFGATGPASHTHSHTH